MNKKLHISIPSPCHEKWQDMTPAEKGRFCSSCQKVVHDFTRSSDREIAAAITKENNLCGRFLSTQLERDLVIPKEKNTIWMAASAAVVSFLSLGTEAAAQNPVATEQIPTTGYGNILGKAAPSTSIISGVVYDDVGMPIPAVDITVEGTILHVQTDFDGKYAIEAKQGNILIFSFVGFKVEKVIIGTANTVNVTLTTERLEQDLIVMGYRTTKPISGAVSTISIEDIENRNYKPTFFGRMFRKIGNLFRKNE